MQMISFFMILSMYVLYLEMSYLSALLVMLLLMLRWNCVVRFLWRWLTAGEGLGMGCTGILLGAILGVSLEVILEILLMLHFPILNH